MLLYKSLLAAASVALVACGAMGPATELVAKNDARISYGGRPDIAAAANDAPFGSAETVRRSAPIGAPARLALATDHVAMLELAQLSSGVGCGRSVHRCRRRWVRRRAFPA